MEHREELERLEETLNRHPKNKPLDENGHEVLDPRPMAPPVGYQRQPSMVEHIRSMVRSELLAAAALKGGHETFEEADDFEVGEDYDPASPYEGEFEPVDWQALKAEEARKRKAGAPPAEPAPKAPAGPSEGQQPALAGEPAKPAGAPPV